MTSREALLALATEFSDFINEPPQYEDQRMVRDYRHELARKWWPILELLLSPAQSSAQMSERINVIVRDYGLEKSSASETHDALIAVLGVAQGYNATQRELEILELRKLASHWKERHDEVLQKHIECCGVAQQPTNPVQTIPLPLWAAEDLLKWMRKTNDRRPALYPIGLENLVQALVSALPSTLHREVE